MGATQAIAAKLTLDVAKSIKPFIDATPADKAGWKPLEQGRSILELVQECAVVNAWFAEMLRTGSVPNLDTAAYEAACAALDTIEKAGAALEANTATLAAVIEAFPDEKLEEELVFPWGMKTTCGHALFTAQGHMSYHQGQIAYIQVLYGDAEMH